MTLTTVLVIIALLAGVIYWLMVITEGIYLGRRIVVWLYDITAGSYDEVKEFDAVFEHQAIAAPLLLYLENMEGYRVLDVATGTARVPLLLLSDRQFDGQLIGLDPSPKMLGSGLNKLSALPVDRRKKLTFVRQYSDRLPFRDNSFNVVTCLEALEFFPSDQDAIAEMVRVLRPGGLLMTTRRQGWESRFFFGRYRSRDSQARMLREAGLVSIEYYPWQVNYDMVRAFKDSI